MRFISYINGCCCSKKVGQQSTQQTEEEVIFELKRNLTDLDEIAQYIIAWSNRPAEDILQNLEESEQINTEYMNLETDILNTLQGLEEGSISGIDVDHRIDGENRYVVIPGNGYQYTYVPEYGIVFIELS